MIKIFTLLAICMCIEANAQEDAVESKLIKNGMYVDSFVGIATTDYSDRNIGYGLKLEHMWYFGESNIWRPGLKTVWLRGAAYIGDNHERIIQGSILNIGFSNIIEFKQNLGLEANINLGYNIVYIENEFTHSDDYFTGGGMMINPEVKIRYKIFAVGLDFVFTNITEYGYTEDNNLYYNTTSGHYYNVYNSPIKKTGLTAINFTIGVKF